MDICTSQNNTITSTQFIKDPQTLVSTNKIFKLGFFSPVNTTNRYVGILYNSSVVDAVWVANRGRPLNDSFGTLGISEDGNLMVLDGQKMVIWSSNVTDLVSNASAELLDTGNLVLRDNSNGRTLWESFQNPSDSILENMRFSSYVESNERTLLRSWKSPSDPSIGRFSASLEPLNIPQIFVRNGNRKHWRSGPWNGQTFLGVPNMNSVYLSGFSIGDDTTGTMYLTFTYPNNSALIHYTLSSEGVLMEKEWSDSKHDWEATWLSQEDECDLYGKCGKYGSCNSEESPICTCIKGFEPKNMEEWSRGNWSSGCIRRTRLQCDRNNTSKGTELSKEDGFLKLTTVKVPDFAMWVNAPEEDCASRCLTNCSCVAYAINYGIGCMYWSDDLIDIVEFSGTRGMDLYVRVAYSELDKKGNRKTVIAIVAAVIGSIIAVICSYFCWKLMAKRAEMKRESEMLLYKRGIVFPELEYSTERMAEDNMNKVKLEEIPLFNYETLAAATENFHLANKQGQGGFGPVYKGKLAGGQLIAVKRLSRSSGQGLEEFMNEVLVIAKLQHRNLVRLLGCCIEGEEKMLIYEYMPNRSLDAFLFDKLKQEQLDWRKREKIIEGIGRGLLYLHRDSRLKIIHRDLKASNILLDEELYPKISDFGMARIFGGDQDQANTRRVVGTYGYMAPEYAMEGRFSEKSDVYSFGVLLLEIVSGRRNTSFYQDENALSLVGYAWKLWNEEEIVKLVDSRILNPRYQAEIIRNIHVGLLCVQEFAKDRPSVSTVLSMLSSEIADLPAPKQAAFTERRKFSDTIQQPQTCSINNVTVTIIEAR